ncbi:hypothetical protein GGX14DRAFT_589811 [Mycena pura]|uniref:Non-ribosomal peptide synthetase n=1 Tax=Mycena pura TaxID=153505 RepID=A0AAD6VW51_9AGAR|nr:hypothetical protein GGX14DRAFT_589811 [Mycena pura]
MSTEKVDSTASPAYSDAEKGVLDSLPVQLSHFPVEKNTGALLTEVRREHTAVAKPTSKPKPKKHVSKWILWKIWFNTYRKFFTFVFTLNMVGIGLATSGHFPYAVNNTGALVLGNLNFAILMRNEVFGRFLYLIVNTCFAKWTPLWFRLGCTSVLQHLGGIHSGCALSGVLWLLFKVVNNFRHLDVTHDAILIMGVVTNAAVMLSALSAFPWVRNTHHNVFERQHRFIGWIGLISTWIFVILGDTYNPINRSWNLNGDKLIQHQDFWFTCGMTFFIALPWICVREVPVDIELPSPKVAIIRFRRGMQQGLLGRISRSSIMEYHAFGIISEGTHAKYHYMIAGVQGDFTKGLVNDPPKTLWTRELKFAGVSNTSTLYTRGIRICTGTGIGAALSTCLQSPYWWVLRSYVPNQGSLRRSANARYAVTHVNSLQGSDQEKTFGPTISGLIHRHMGPERVTLWDSKQRGGRPDTMKLLKEVYYSWNAEVVFITSNFIGNSEMMEGCKAAGIPAFGTLWDF